MSSLEGVTREAFSVGSCKKGCPVKYVDLFPGEVYVVTPQNPKARHHRGRYCEFVGLRRHDGAAAVIFTGTRRLGFVDCGNLLPVKSKDK
jgi:hypothetical protein